MSSNDSENWFEDVDSIPSSVDEDYDDSSSYVSETDDFTVPVCNGWQHVTVGKEEKSTVLPEFVGTAGFMSSIDISVLSSQMDFINIFLNDDCWNLLAEFINCRAAQTLKNTENIKWKVVDGIEVRYWYCVGLLMGYAGCPNIDLYWDEDPICRLPFFNNCPMKKNRFKQILKNLMFSNPLNIDSGNEHTYIQDFFHHVKNLLRQTYSPSKNLAFVATVLPNKAQYRTRRHSIDPISLSETTNLIYLYDTNGYLLNMEISTSGVGITDDYADKIDALSAFSPAEKMIVHQLNQAQCLDKGHHVVVDADFNSTRLQEYLLTRKTTVSGPVRVNRGIPKSIVATELPKFASDFWRNGNLLAVKYRESKCVYYLSSNDTADTDKVKRIVSWRSRMMVSEPTLVIDYKIHRANFRRSNSNRVGYSFVRKSFPWWQKAGLFLMHHLLFNAFLLYKQYRDPTAKFRKFEENYFKTFLLPKKLPMTVDSQNLPICTHHEDYSIVLCNHCASIASPKSSAANCIDS